MSLMEYIARTLSVLNIEMAAEDEDEDFETALKYVVI